jgi:polysaccharide biosynthesis transport protein
MRSCSAKSTRTGNYDGLLQRYKEIGAAGVGTNNISVVDTGMPSRKPSSPNLFLNLALSLLAGLGLAAALVFLLEQLDQSIRDPSEVIDRFGLPLLGSIPKVEANDFEELLLDKKSMVYEAYLQKERAVRRSA